jgi:ParB family chromosome partitioning protein
MFAETFRKKKASVLMIPVQEITASPFQPRQTFASEALSGLTQSIRENGILQPLTVRRLSAGGFELIAGERRLRAAAAAGLTGVPCVVIDASDSQSAIFSLLENVQREDLDCFEEAEGMARLLQAEGITQEELAAQLGKSQPAVANKLRLLRLAPEERVRISKEGLTERHARALLKLSGEDRTRALDKIIANKLNVAQAEKLVDSMLGDKQVHKPHTLPVVKDVRIFINTFNNAVDVMRSAGIDAVADSREYDDYLEYTVRIPKERTTRSA